MERGSKVPTTTSMYHGAQEGWVEVVSGVMFSGKSEELMRRVRRSLIAKKRVQVFKSHLDDRYGGVQRISSHDGTEIEARPVTSSVQIAEAIEPRTQVVGIDEAQFLDEGVVSVVTGLADVGDSGHHRGDRHGLPGTAVRADPAAARRRRADRQAPCGVCEVR